MTILVGVLLIVVGLLAVWLIRLDTHVARYRQEVVTMVKQLEANHKAHTDLLAAFDAWFDVVAGELGYEAVEGYSWNFPYTPFPVSPRQHRTTTTPTIVAPVRVEPKICAKRRKGSA